MHSWIARVPTGPELDLLARCCGYRISRAGRLVVSDEAATSAELRRVEDAGWVLGPVEIPVDEVVRRLRDAAMQIDVGQVTRAFVAGVGGSAPRGRQPLISYSWARHLPATVASGAPELPDTGLTDPVEIDFADEAVSVGAGMAWNELPERYLVDLEAAASEGLPEPVESDWVTFGRLLDEIRQAPDDMTPGQLEKQISKQKILPGAGKYERYGVLMGLAEIGVMPNSVIDPSFDRFIPKQEYLAAHERLPGSPRSDIVLPLAAWRGKLGLDESRAAALFQKG